MQIFSKEQIKKNNDEVFRRHGRIDKLLDENGKVMGHLVRIDADEESLDYANIVVNLSFNFNYFVNPEKDENSTYKNKEFRQIDLKHFAIKKALDFNIPKNFEKLYDNMPYTLTYDGKNVDIFKIGLSGIVVALMNALFEKYETCRRYYAYGSNWEKHFPSYYPEKIGDYVFNKLANVLNYYKGKKMCFFFI